MAIYWDVEGDKGAIMRVTLRDRELSVVASSGVRPSAIVAAVLHASRVRFDWSAGERGGVCCYHVDGRPVDLDRELEPARGVWVSVALRSPASMADALPAAAVAGLGRVH